MSAELPQRAYSSADGAAGMLGHGASGIGGGSLNPAAAEAIGAALERPHSASSAAEEDVHRRLAHLGTGFGPGFF